jgi:hypothetical protein
MTRKERVVLEVACAHLRIDSLTPQNSDSLDFHDCGVLSIKAALEAAYDAGYKACAVDNKLVKKV